MTGRLPPLLLLFASIAALGAALIAQFGFEMEPCHLCTLQRLPHAFAILVALAALLEARDGRQRGVLLAILALIAASGAGLAFFHVGVEQHWWESACAEAEKLSSNAGGLLARLKAGKPAAACDSVPFELFGLSLAGLNLLLSLALTAYAALAARRAFQS